MFLPCLRTAQSALCHNPFMNQVYFHAVRSLAEAGKSDEES